ncbi:MAG: transporter permease [Clostridiales bacterium]|jgi:ABC-2 type transport system permease protein|nr:transporter permease [Clostridiales bacterium]
MKNPFKTYSAFTKAGIQDAIAYRANFLGFFIGEIFYCFVMFFIWKAVFNSSNSPTFMGFSMIDMTLYLFLTNITVFLTDTDSSYAIGEEIRDGSISMRLIKPIKIDLSLLFFELGNKIIIISMVFIPIILGIETYRTIATGGIAFDIVQFLFFILSIVLSYLLSFYLNLAFGYLAFFLMNLWGFNMLKGAILRFLSGGAIPIAFLPIWLQGTLKIMPFASLNYTPVMIYMGKYTGTDLIYYIGLQFVWVIAFILLCKFIWHLAAKHLCVQGG